MHVFRWFLVFFVAFGFFAGCAKQKQSRYYAVQAGYTKEFDEPSSRGMLMRVSPEIADVRRKFSLSHDEKYIVFSGLQKKLEVGKDGEVLGSKRLGSEPLDLWKIPASGGAPVKITSGGDRDCLSPSFTKNSEFIVYESGGTMWKIRSDGAGGRTKIPGSGLGYDHSPDVCEENNQLVFVTTQNILHGGRGVQTSTIWTSNLSGSELTQIREGDNPQWAPNCKYIAFDYKEDVWIVGSDGIGLTQLTSTPKVNEGIPSWSPDGKRIVFVSNEDLNDEPLRNGDFNIWVMEANGTSKEQLTSLDSWDSWPAIGRKGVYFLSARAAADKSSRVQKIWLIGSKQTK